MFLGENLREKLRDAVIDFTYPLARLGLIKLSETKWTAWHLKRELQKCAQEKTTVGRIAFFVSNYSVFEHMKFVFRYLPANSFDIVVSCRKSLLGVLLNGGNFYIPFDDLQSRVKKIGCSASIRSINEVMENNERYPLAVFSVGSLLAAERYRGYSGAKKIADQPMLLADVWHEDMHSPFCVKCFKKVFCMGPLQKSYLESLHTRAKILDYGAPRFDGVFLKKHLAGKVVCLSLTHTLPERFVCRLIGLMQQIADSYSITLGYGACTLRDRRMINRVSLKMSGIRLEKMRDNSELMKVADFVVCDWLGGSCLTAVAMDKNIVLLKARKPFLSTDDGEFKFLKEMLYDKLGTFSIDDYDKIVAVLKDDAYWERQRVVRAELRKQFFSFHKEPSGKLIADELMRDLKAASERNVKA